MAPKGKWAAGITPRNFCWVIKDRLAICERPGGYSTNHRRVRRQEEIIWIREQGFTCVVSLLESPHNLHNYDELGVWWVHRPFTPGDGARETLAQLYAEVREALAGGGKLILHRNQLDDAVAGLVAGYLRWTGLVPTGPRAISLVEQITHRQLGPLGRQLVGIGSDLPPAGSPGTVGPAFSAMVPTATATAEAPAGGVAATATATAEAPAGGVAATAQAQADGVAATAQAQADGVAAVSAVGARSADSDGSSLAGPLPAEAPSAAASTP